VTLRLHIPVVHGPNPVKVDGRLLLLLPGTESHCADLMEISRGGIRKEHGFILELGDKDSRVREGRCEGPWEDGGSARGGSAGERLGDPLNGVRDAAAVSVEKT